MKLFIYYSLSGNLDMVANKLKEKGCDIIKVVPSYKIPTNKVKLFLNLGFLAWVNKKFKLIDFNPDISKYDEIIIGSPIWNSRISCPINAVLNQLDFTNKKVSIVLSSASGKAKTALKKIKRKNISSNVIILKEPKKYADELNKLVNI